MNNNDLNTEQILLEAAEAEFLEKGYGNTKMMAIAKRAGVSHSMLHYYFRSKENLFQTVFLKKVAQIAPSFESIFGRHLPFPETVRLIVETQFDFAAQNPKLPHFILTEVMTNAENRALLLEVLTPKLAPLLSKMGDMLEEEAKKGNIRPIKLHDFLLNAFSMNISTFIALPILQETVVQNGDTETMLSQRRESNVQFVLSALRP